MLRSARRGKAAVDRQLAVADVARDVA